MLRFGAVTIDVSHPRAFASELKKGDRAAYTAVFNDCFRTDEEVKAFADDFGLTIYDDLDEMIDNIDLGLKYLTHGILDQRFVAIDDDILAEGRRGVDHKLSVGKFDDVGIIEIAGNGISRGILLHVGQNTGPNKGVGIHSRLLSV